MMGLKYRQRSEFLLAVWLFWWEIQSSPLFNFEPNLLLLLEFGKWIAAVAGFLP